MTTRSAALEDPGLSGAALALRPEPRRSAPGRRDRGRGRPGREARRRRHAARAEDHRARGGMRDLPVGIDQRSACRHPDWTGPDDLEIKIQELREITDWEKPIYVKVGATRTHYDVALAVKAGADVVVVDGMQGGTAATQDVFIEHVGIPTLPAIRLAVQALQELDMHRKVQLIVSGGIRSGADVAKALALGADAVSIGVAALIALGCNKPVYSRTIRSARHHGRLLPPLPHRPLPGRDHDPGSGAAEAPRRPRRARLAELPDRPDAGAADPGARLRQEPCAQSRARGSRGADGRGRGNGAGAAGRHRLDSGQDGLLRASQWQNARRLEEAGQKTPWANLDHSTRRPRQGHDGDQVFPDQLRRSVRRACARSWCPPQRSRDMQRTGAGFAGFATWLDMTPAASRHVRHARPRQPDPAALAARGRLARGRSVDGRQGGGRQPARGAEASRSTHAAQDGWRMKTGVECEYFLINAGRQGARRQRDTQEKPCYDQSALMRRYEVITEICDAHARARLGALSERP